MIQRIYPCHLVKRGPDVQKEEVRHDHGRLQRCERPDERNQTEGKIPWRLQFAPKDSTCVCETQKEQL